MKAAYRIADRKDSQALARFLSGEGQILLPMLGLIEQAEMAVDELIDVAGRATIEAVLTLSAQGLAGPKPPGNRTQPPDKTTTGATPSDHKGEGVIGWHGQQRGVVNLAKRKLRISKPRLRRKEVPLGAKPGTDRAGSLSRSLAIEDTDANGLLCEIGSTLVRAV